MLAERLKDERSKKVIFVSHCILNENARYLGGAFRKGCIDEIFDEIQKQGVGIIQMECPEQKAWGGIQKRDVLRGFGSRNTLLYKFRKLYISLFIWNTKRIYRKIAKDIVAEIKDYVDSGFEVVGIIGIAGSPSCGVNTTLNIEKFAEFMANTNIGNLDRKKINEFMIKRCLIKRSGFFIEALKNELKKKNIKIKFYEHDLISEMEGKNIKLKI